MTSTDGLWFDKIRIRMRNLFGVKLLNPNQSNWRPSVILLPIVNVVCTNLKLCHGTRVVLLLGDDECKSEWPDDFENLPLVLRPQIAELFVNVQNSPDSLQNDSGTGRTEAIRRFFSQRDHQKFTNLVVVHVHGF